MRSAVLADLVSCWYSDYKATLLRIRIPNSCRRSHNSTSSSRAVCTEKLASDSPLMLFATISLPSQPAVKSKQVLCVITLLRILLISPRRKLNSRHRSSIVETSQIRPISSGQLSLVWTFNTHTPPLSGHPRINISLSLSIIGRMYTQYQWR